MSTFVDVTCAVRRKDSLCAFARWFCVSRKGGTGEDGWGHRRVTCTWWLLWLSVEMPLLALGGPILALFAQIGLETLLSPCRVFISGSKGFFGSEWIFAGREC